MASGGEAWQDFMARPADYAAPIALADAFGGAVSEETCDRLLASERLRDRLSAVLTRHYMLEGGAAEDLSAEDRRIAASASEEIELLALRAGATFFASSLAGSISGSRASAMRTALGNELCAFALANRDLARPEDRLDDAKDVREQVEQMGLACLKAWCDGLPKGVATRFLMKIPEIAEIEHAIPDDRGPDLLRRAAV